LRRLLRDIMNLLPEDGLKFDHPAADHVHPRGEQRFFKYVADELPADHEGERGEFSALHLRVLRLPDGPAEREMMKLELLSC